jgi:hypothetical protein
VSRKARAFPDKISWDVDDNSKLVLKTHKMFSWHLSRLLKDIEREARAEVERNHPKTTTNTTPNTGALKSSIHSNGVTQKSRSSRFIYGSVSAGSANAPYAKYVHGGHDAHTRTRPGPAGDKYLFFWSGRESKRSYRMPDGIRPIRLKDKKVYVKTVKMGARTGDPFLRTAARTVIAQRRSGRS